MFMSLSRRLVKALSVALLFLSLTVPVPVPLARGFHTACNWMTWNCHVRFLLEGATA